MRDEKEKILNNICYTELVYDRINRKLGIHMSKPEIEEMLFAVVRDTDERHFQRIGKNIYVTCHNKNIRVAINSHTFRVITVDPVTPPDGDQAAT